MAGPLSSTSNKPGKHRFDVFLKEMRHIEMPKAAPKSAFVIFKN